MVPGVSFTPVFVQGAQVEVSSPRPFSYRHAQEPLYPKSTRDWCARVQVGSLEVRPFFMPSSRRSEHQYLDSLRMFPIGEPS